MPFGAFVEQFGPGNATGENDRVHRETVRPKMGVEEMEREDESGGEQRFIGMNNERDVDDPAGQEEGEEFRKPEDQS